ncbi:MAG: cyclase [Streptosporangiales bacterium]|nr:cyclase [Streptosporangiales bacterium]
MADRTASPVADLPVDRLKQELKNLAGAYATRAVKAATGRVEDTAGRLTEYAEGGGPGLKAALTGAQAKAQGKSGAFGALKGAVSGIGNKVKEKLGGGSSGGGTKVKVTNMVEDIDVGVPVRVAYNQWTQFQDWAGFMKKVEWVDQKEDEKLGIKAQVFWSHRAWDATITEQVPDERIVWKSSGEKGYVDGTVTFHELAPRLTKILVVLEYHPQGLFEKTGNLWRAQGRRARLELKHFRRHVMTRTILDPDAVEGWRGEIRDGEVVLTHEDALDQEQERDAEDDDERDEEEEEEERETAASDDEYEDEEPEEEAEEEEPSRGNQRRRRTTATSGARG